MNRARWHSSPFVAAFLGCLCLLAILWLAKAKPAKCGACLELSVVPDDLCVYEPIPPAAWKSAGNQLGIRVGTLAKGVYGMHRYEDCLSKDYSMGAPLTSLEILSHGHLAKITLDNGQSGIQIRSLGSKPVYIGDIPAGASRTIMGGPIR